MSEEFRLDCKITVKDRKQNAIEERGVKNFARMGGWNKVFAEAEGVMTLQLWPLPLVCRAGDRACPLLKNASAVALVATEYDYRFRSQDHVVNRGADRAIGGGSSAIDAGFYSRGSDDYVSLGAGFDARMVASIYAWVDAALAFFSGFQQRRHSAVTDARLETGVDPTDASTYEHGLKGTRVGGSIFAEAAKRHPAANLLQHSTSANNMTALLSADVHVIGFAPPVRGTPPKARGAVVSGSLRVRHQAFLHRGFLERGSGGCWGA